MITKLENGRIYDPINKINGKIKAMKEWEKYLNRLSKE